MQIRKQERSFGLFKNCYKGHRFNFIPSSSGFIIIVVFCGIFLFILMFLTCMIDGELVSISFLGDAVIRRAAGATVHITTTTSDATASRTINGHNKLGAVVILAPSRNEITWWDNTSRFCFLMRAVRSIDYHLNRHYGPYPIYILITKDHRSDPRHKDDVYTTKDQALIRSWAPHTPDIIFHEINLYTDDALEPKTTVEQIMSWRNGNGSDGAIPGRDLGYQSMSRLWSGRVQQMPFLQQYSYYLRMDDDSLLVDKFPVDPFQFMQQRNLDYLWRRDSAEEWGVEKLNQLLQKHKSFLKNPTLFQTQLSPTQYEYTGLEPYNNFHVSRVSFWSEPKWQTFWNDLNAEHAFFKYRLGDANVHAAAIMMMERTLRKYDIPYVHNSNDMRDQWGQSSWRLECEEAEKAFGIGKMDP